MSSSVVKRAGLTLGPASASIPVQVVTPPIRSLPEAEPQPELSVSAEERLAQVQADCAAMIAEADAKARQIVETARAQAVQIEDQARTLGYQDGFEAGQRQAEAEMAQVVAETIEHARAVAASAATERTRLLEHLAEPLTTVVMEAVRRVLYRELSVQSVDIERMVDELLQFVIESSKVEVRVHPDDFEAARSGHARWQHAKLGDWEVSVVPDPAIQPGGCEIRSEFGRVDATVETKLDILQNTLRTVMERSVTEFVAAERC
ncbi:hypothetical protein JI721_00420 [Alicyclobacillus cycloheptanicus]|uniref:Flagellar assembly protein FliH/type III secretion protein L n=1 Tax=Alicyclobacillus cycloheptanicus TaxID=1457 RepID=A0ABT9XJS3_9BACL|nr:FliH/SctL family protein [Alicyclobacillus cycloheptanicus]MDQ0190559.1 flagellar assembly protein FliH/type III secretion protein L [Alicyclobacillus cycloheptanicus]WDM01400.1 hypothetical protein JI721_00420 [Alicyclobacillus cycloheptanicus]